LRLIVVITSTAINLKILIRRLNIKVRRTADPQRGAFGQRLIPADDHRRRHFGFEFGGKIGFVLRWHFQNGPGRGHAAEN